MHLYISGWIVGCIVFQSAIVAPTLFKSLSIEHFSAAVRALWPKFFALTAISGGALLVALWFAEGASTAQWVIALCTSVFGAVCYAIVPATNRATDTGNHRQFNLLHRMSIFMTIAALIANLIFPFA